MQTFQNFLAERDLSGAMSDLPEARKIADRLNANFNKDRKHKIAISAKFYQDEVQYYVWTKPDHGPVVKQYFPVEDNNEDRMMAQLKGFAKRHLGE